MRTTMTTTKRKPTLFYLQEIHFKDIHWPKVKEHKIFHVNGNHKKAVVVIF